MKPIRYILAALVLALAQSVAQAPDQAGAPTASDTSRNSGTLQFGDPVEAGKPIRTPNIAIPTKFRKKDGFVILHGTIAADGSFRDLKAVTGDQALINPSLDAVQQWMYSPCTLNGAPIDLPTYVALSFSKGTISASIEPDLPFPTGPRKPIPEQISEGRLFRIGHGVTPPRSNSVTGSAVHANLAHGKVQRRCCAGYDRWSRRKPAGRMDNAEIGFRARSEGN